MTEKMEERKDWKYRCHPTEDEMIGYWAKTKFSQCVVVLVVYLPHPSKRDDSIDIFLKTLANKKKPYNKDMLLDDTGPDHVFVPMDGFQSAKNYQEFLSEKGFFSKVFVQGEVAN